MTHNCGRLSYLALIVCDAHYHANLYILKVNLLVFEVITRKQSPYTVLVQMLPNSSD